MNIEDFRAPTSPVSVSKKPTSPPRRKPAGWFIKGPIPGEWISLASKLPGRSLHVALALRYLSGLQKTHRVKFTGQTRDQFGIPPDAARRGLQALERGGLVAVKGGSGRSPIVTILELDANDA